MPRLSSLEARLIAFRRNVTGEFRVAIAVAEDMSFPPEDKKARQPL